MESAAIPAVPRFVGHEEADPAVAQCQGPAPGQGKTMGDSGGSGGVTRRETECGPTPQERRARTGPGARADCRRRCCGAAGGPGTGRASPRGDCFPGAFRNGKGRWQASPGSVRRQSRAAADPPQGETRRRHAAGQRGFSRPADRHRIASASQIEQELRTRLVGHCREDPIPDLAVRDSARTRIARPIPLKNRWGTRRRGLRRSGWTRATSRARSPSRRRGVLLARGRDSIGSSGRSVRRP